MREIIFVVRVPEVDEPDSEHFPRDGDELVHLETTVKRGEWTYQASLSRDRVAILTVDRLVDYVGRVMASIAENKTSDGD